LAATRAETLDTHAMELRRIERDLHDGAQAQLTALAMNLGLAEQLLNGDEQARALIAEARSSAGTALEGLRDIVRGIYPPVLAERGLAGGVHELALAAAVPVELQVELPGRLAEPMESALYFSVAELLTNVTRHGAATQAQLRLRLVDGMVRLTVRDDGRGGAAFRPGGGLDGLRRRLAAFDGWLTVDSPAGGPTVAEVVVPCVS
jgi:signal transduction histidine kinase